MGKQLWYVISHPGQLSLAIPQQINTIQLVKDSSKQARSTTPLMAAFQ